MLEVRYDRKDCSHEMLIAPEQKHFTVLKKTFVKIETLVKHHQIRASNPASFTENNWIEGALQFRLGL